MPEFGNARSTSSQKMLSFAKQFQRFETLLDLQGGGIVDRVLMVDGYTAFLAAQPRAAMAYRLKLDFRFDGLVC